MFLNSTDPISQGYAIAVNSENEDRVYWGTPTYYPVGAHTYQQWMDNPTDYQTTDALGENMPKETEHDENWTERSNQMHEQHDDEKSLVWKKHSKDTFFFVTQIQNMEKPTKSEPEKKYSVQFRRILRTLFFFYFLKESKKKKYYNESFNILKSGGRKTPPKTAE